MTQKELHNQRLVNEARARTLGHSTRRHFLKESAMGLGALALGALLPGCMPGSGGAGDGSGVVFDPANPLAPKLPMFPRKGKERHLPAYGRGAPSSIGARSILNRS